MILFHFFKLSIVVLLFENNIRYKQRSHNH